MKGSLSRQITAADLYETVSGRQNRWCVKSFIMPGDYSLLFTFLLKLKIGNHLPIDCRIQRASHNLILDHFGKKNGLHLRRHIISSEAGHENRSECRAITLLKIWKSQKSLIWSQSLKMKQRNASQVRWKVIQAIKDEIPEKMIAVVTTSSMAGMSLTFH